MFSFEYQKRVFDFYIVTNSTTESAFIANFSTDSSCMLENHLHE